LGISFSQKNPEGNVMVIELSQFELLSRLYAVASEAMTDSKIDDLVISECFRIFIYKIRGLPPDNELDFLVVFMLLT
jgi:hypothetical protein